MTWCSPQAGSTPLDAPNINNRIFRPLSKELGFPVTWHVFRHSAATFCEHVEMPMSDREKLMGHAKAHMTAHYRHSDVVRRRRYQNEIAARLLPPQTVPAANHPKDDPGLAELERLFDLEAADFGLRLLHNPAACSALWRNIFLGMVLLAHSERSMKVFVIAR